ncbi:unnamed protein product, partial [Lymnaea stagnalis]
MYLLNLKRAINDDAERAAKKMKVKETAMTKHSLPNFVQTPLTSMTDFKMVWPEDHVAVQIIDKSHKCIMDLIIVDMLPYSIVEGDEFKRLNIAIVTEHSSLDITISQKRELYRTTLMPATYDKVVKHVINLLQEAAWISFTTDRWSNPTKSCSLLSFTAHFIHAAVRRKVSLSAMVLEQDHDGHYLASKLREAIAKWGIAEKIHFGVRDNATKMNKCAMKLAGVADIGYVSHILYGWFCMMRCLKFTQTSVEAVIRKARKIVTHFKHSEQACCHLAEHQLTINVPAHSLLQDVETRWNSSYLMLERLLERTKPIDLFSVERGRIDSLSNAEWALAGKIVKLLKPFHAATLEICAEDACISLVIPLVANLNSLLKTTSADQGLKQMKAALRDAMCRRFSDINSSAPYLAAILIHPRFK